MAEILAHSPDGVVLHFPEGTDINVIQNAIKSHVQQVMQPPAPPNQAAKSAAAVQPVSGGLNQATPSNYLFGNPSNVTQAKDNTVDILRNIIPPAAGAAAGTATAPSAPFTLGAGPAAASIGAYGVVDTLLKKLKSNEKDSLPDSFKDSIVQAAINEAGGRIVSGAWKTAKAFTAADQPEIIKFIPTASQALQADGKHPTVANILKFVEDHFAPGSKAAAVERSAAAGSELGYKQAAQGTGLTPNVFKDSNLSAEYALGGLKDEVTQEPGKIIQRTADYQPIKIIPGEQAQPFRKNQPYTPSKPSQTVATGAVEQTPIPGAYEIIPGAIKKTPYATDPASLDKLISDPTRLQKALAESQAAGIGNNARQDIAGYNLARIQQAATTLGPNGVQRIDANKIFQMLDDPSLAASNKILYGNKISDIRQFYKNLSITQQKLGDAGFQRIMVRGDAIALPIAFIHSALSGNATAALTTSGIVGLQLGGAALAKALTKPNSGRLMLALANNEALGVSEQYAARQIMQAVQGTVGSVIQADGSEVPVKFGQGGRLEPLGMQSQ